MYKDNSKLDVELLAEVGNIAHRIRNLNKKLALNLDEQQSEHQRATGSECNSLTNTKADGQFTDTSRLTTKTTTITTTTTTTATIIPTTATTTTKTCSSPLSQYPSRRNSAIKIAQDNPSKFRNETISPSELARRHYSTKQIEDIILEFYEKHLIYHQKREKETQTKATTESESTCRSKIYRLNRVDLYNMNDLPDDKTTKKCTKLNINDDDDANAADSTKNDANSDHWKEKQSESSSGDALDTNAGCSTAKEKCLNLVSEAAIDDKNVNEDDIAEKQISGSQTGTRNTPPTEFERKEFAIGAGDSNEIVVGGSCSHYCGGWQTSACINQLSDDDLRALVVELKRKVEFTERMNWLCLSRRPAGPPHRKTSLPKHTEVKKRFLEICDRTLSEEIKSALRLPQFDSYEWEDEDVLFLMQTMFIDTGLVEKFNIPLATLREWLYEVYKHYNAVPFHNFRHCFCVAQMMYVIACRTNLSARLGDLEVLILLVSCICHDLDHPGYNNIYQINARTELALRYNDISPLENHHCSIAFRLLEHPDCNIFKNFSKETFNEIREGIIRCILATDMARHNEILTQFQEISPNFDYSNEAHINLLCMVLIKVADISNEARPMDIAEPWLERLLQEFFAQSAAEKSEGLPVTPFMDPDKVSKPGSQVRFIGLVLLPLFEALGELLPELVDLIIQPVRDALDYYKRLNDAQNKSRKSLGEVDSCSDGKTSPQLPRSQSGISVRSRRSVPSQKSSSRTSVDEPLCISAELHDLPEGSESGDSETATEVEVAEKTSKFKVDTEGGNRNKNAQMSSRKGSREKRPSMISEICTTGVSTRMRGSYGNIHNYPNNRSNFGASRAISLDQYNTSRRSSDGLPQVTSDNNVYYHQLQHFSLDSEVPSITTGSVKLTATASAELPSDTSTHNLPASLIEDKSKSQLQQQFHQYQSQHKYTSNKILSGASLAANSGTKSFMTRLRQFTGRFSFSFERDPKRNSSETSPTSNVFRNNNANESTLPITKGSFCCSNKTLSSSSLHHRKNEVKNSTMTVAQSPTAISNTRNRAFSLDVPDRMQHSSSNTSGDADGNYSGVGASSCDGYRRDAGSSI